MSKDSSGSTPVGFWKFTIVVSVLLLVVQKNLVRDPSFAFLKGVPVFAVAVLLWLAYRYFRRPDLFSMRRVPVPTSVPIQVYEEAPREARVQRVLTADDLRRLHKHTNKKTARAYQASISTEKTTITRVGTVAPTVSSNVASHVIPLVKVLPSLARVRHKQVRYKTTGREKTVRTKRVLS